MKLSSFTWYALKISLFLMIACDQRGTLIPPPQEKPTIAPLSLSDNKLLFKQVIKRELLPQTPICIENNMCFGNKLPSGIYTPLAGTSPSDMWALSDENQGLFYFDGTKWVLVPNSFGISGKTWTKTANQVWILDKKDGSFFQCKPTGCEKRSVFSVEQFYIYSTVWNFLETGSEQFWFFSWPYEGLSKPMVYRFDGTKPDGMQWQSIDFHQMAKDKYSMDAYFLGQLWGSSDTDIWAVLFTSTAPLYTVPVKLTLVHYNGMTLDKKIDLLDDLSLAAFRKSHIMGTSSSNIWFTYPRKVGPMLNDDLRETESVFYYYDGMTWEKKDNIPFLINSKNKDYLPPFLFQSNGNQIWMQAFNIDVGYNQLWQWDNTNWRLEKVGNSGFLFATDRNNLWWIDKNREVQTNHPTFSLQQDLILDKFLHEGKDTLWFSSDRDRALLYKELIRYQKGKPFKTYAFSNQYGTISALWSNPDNPNALWISTNDGLLHHVDNIENLDNQTTYDINVSKNSKYYGSVTAFWGSQTHGLWAISNDSRILHFQDPNWIVDTQETGKKFEVLHGTGSNTLWVGGKNTLMKGIIQNTNVTWTDMRLSISASEQFQIEKIWDAGENNVWFSGWSWKEPQIGQSFQKLFHFDGQTISLVQTPSQKVYDFTGDSKGNIWATVEIKPNVIELWQKVDGSWVQRTLGGFSWRSIQATENFGLFQFGYENFLWKKME